MVEQVDDWQPVAKDDWQPVAPQQEAEPLSLTGAEPLPQPFLDRIAQGQALSTVANEHGQRSAMDKLLGINGPRYQLWPERLIRSAITLPKDVMTGQVISGPGLRKEDFSDDPDAPEPLDTLIARAQDMSAAQLGQTSFEAAMRSGSVHPLVTTADGHVARPYSDADGVMRAQVIGAPPKPDDFKAAASVLGSKEAEPNLKALWQEQGVHPAEAAVDASRDAFLRHDLTTKAEEVKPDETMKENWPEPLPQSLGAAVNDLPEPTPLADQPPPQPGKLSAAIKTIGDNLYDIGRDTQMLIHDAQMRFTPMATGTRDSMAMAKDFANTMRRNRWEWSRIDDDIKSRFDPEQRKRMWDAADEESVARQLGESTEHQGLVTLEPEERAAVEDLQARAQNAWLRARDLGMVEGEGLPAYTPRMVINAADKSEGPIALNGIGLNLRTKTGALKHRAYMTAEETEAAAKRGMGEGATIARDIRTLPLATAKLEDAIAGRTLINNIKEYGKRTGTETVAEGEIPQGSATKWFTLDHPAFRTWRPKFEMVDGKMQAAKDANGDTVFQQVPLYVHGDFEGPLRAVLTQRSGPLYSAAMSLKGKTMSLIMNSPLIHNAVEWGRALPAMPGKVATFRIYFDGNRAKNDVGLMREAIDNGLVPIGHRFFKQDISSIMEAPDLTPGRSWTAKLLGFVPGLFDAEAGTAVKRAIDKAGDFWHNTLLWDRVGDLQAGLYVNFRDSLTAKGVDPTTASRMAAHFANRYAGSLPMEAMSDGARKAANMLLFSRTFTLGNIGAIKDMLTGLPRDVLAQIERDAGFGKGTLSAGEKTGEEAAQEAVKYAKTMARRKAMSVVAMDIGLFYIGNSILQNALNIMFNDSTLDQEAHGYVQRLQEMLGQVKEHPLSLLQPFKLMQSASATSDNEPGRQDRLLIGYAKDGTAIYARNPAGKIGEEFIGYMIGPLDMMRRKMGTIIRPAWQILANDKGFGRKIYDPDADTPAKYLKNLGLIAAHIAESQVPLGQLSAFHDLVKGEGDAKVNALQAFGPMAGFTFSKGAPGGPAVGEMYQARSAHDFQVQMALPDIRKQILRGDIAGAQQQMDALRIPKGLQRFYIRTTVNPATRLSGRTLRDFYEYATPEQRQRLERARTMQPQAPQTPLP